MATAAEGTEYTRTGLDMRQVSAHYATLTHEWRRTNSNLEKCVQLVKKLKEFAVEATFNGNPASSLYQQNLRWAQNILEIGAMAAIASSDIDMFDRYVVQLDTFYFDCPAGLLPESSSRLLILGLRLLRLLSRGRKRDFHGLLQKIPAADQQSFYIYAPICLETYIADPLHVQMQTITRQNGHQKHKFIHDVYMDFLASSIKEEVANGMEISYSNLKDSSAANLLNFRSKRDFKKFAKKRRWHHTSDGTLVLPKQDRMDETKPGALPSKKMICQFLQYAINKDNIV